MCEMSEGGVILTMPWVPAPPTVCLGTETGTHALDTMLLSYIDVTQAHYSLVHQLFSYMQIKTFLAFVICYFQPGPTVLM